VSSPVECKQQFFEVKSGRKTCVVPVLALMRALFRPTKDFLPEMFMPQALDRQCRLSVSDAGISVKVDAPWASRDSASERSDWEPIFVWLMAHPSAFNMAGSVHSQAMDGCIALQLPKAEMRMVFRGLNVGAKMFVTDVSVITIIPHDEPSFAVCGGGPTFTMFDRKVPHGATGSFGSLTSQFEVPRHTTGTVELTDVEWSQVETIVLGARKRRRSFKLSRRELLNGVLVKLATGTPWKEVDYSAGTWVNAFQAFRTWALDGTFAAILDVLATHRTAL
jgi:transposase